jgi:mRNA interferase HigB
LASRAQWKSPADIKAAYRNASFTANNRVVSNIKGNDCRLVAQLNLPADVLVKPYLLREQLLVA